MQNGSTDCNDAMRTLHLFCGIYNTIDIWKIHLNTPHSDAYLEYEMDVTFWSETDKLKDEE